MKTTLLSMLAIAASLSLTACSKDHEAQKGLSNSEVTGIQGTDSEDQNNRVLHVTDIYGRPIPQAAILVGDAINQPIASNYISADAGGNFLSPAAWQSPLTVTVAAPGYVRTSFMDQVPQGQTFQLRPAHDAVQFELKGKGLGFQPKDNDNTIDFAMMVPSVRRQDLFSFNMSLFISPQSDVVDVYGQKLNVPSNVSLPRQKENYGFFPVTLDKQQYRMYFDVTGTYRVVALRGQFPFKQVVSEMQNQKPFIELINYFSLKGGSIRQVDIAQTSQILDLPVNELNFTDERNFQTPAFASDEFAVAVALSPFQGEYLPTDFKMVPANSNFKLVTAPGEAPQLLVALKKKSEQSSFTGGRLSAALVPLQNGVRPALLPLIEKPQILSLTDLKAQVPGSISGVQPLATYMVLSSVSKVGSGSEASEILTRLWEVYARDWRPEMHLPQWPGENIQPGSKRWEVTYMGSNGSHKAVDLSPRILETVTHATHSASDF